MSSLRTLLADTAKIDRLFERLAETTPGAVKTRAALLGELKTELKSHAKLERTQLLPILEKHAGTKGLVKAASARLDAVDEQLARMGREPMEGDAFAGAVRELKTLFHAHLRDDRSDLLPAVKKALSEEEAATVAEKMSAAKRASEASEREAAEARRTEARRDREQAEARDAAAALAKRAERKAAADAEHLAASVAEAARVQSETARQAMASGVRVADEVTQQAAAGVAKASGALTRVIDQAPSAMAAVQGLQGVAREWMNWFQARAKNQRDAFASLARCRTPADFLAAQARFAQEDLSLLMESGARMYQIAGRAAPRP